MSCGLFQDEDTKEDEVSTSGSDVDLVSNVRKKKNRRYTLREKKLQKIRKAQVINFVTCKLITTSRVNN